MSEIGSTPWVIVSEEISCYHRGKVGQMLQRPYFILWPVRLRCATGAAPWSWLTSSSFHLNSSSSADPPPSQFWSNQGDLSLHKLSSTRFISFSPPTHPSYHISNVTDVSLFSSKKKQQGLTLAFKLIQPMLLIPAQSTFVSATLAQMLHLTHSPIVHLTPPPPLTPPPSPIPPLTPPPHFSNTSNHNLWVRLKLTETLLPAKNPCHTWSCNMSILQNSKTLWNSSQAISLSKHHLPIDTQLLVSNSQTSHPLTAAVNQHAFDTFLCFDKDYGSRWLYFIYSKPNVIKPNLDQNSQSRPALSD